MPAKVPRRRLAATLAALLLLLDGWLVSACLAPASAQTWYLLHPLSVLLRILHPNSEVAQRWWLYHLLGAVGLITLWFWLNPRPRVPTPAPEYGSHGSARWATDRDLRRHLRADGSGLILGKSGGKPLVLPADPTAPHNQLAIIFGGPGSRKTRTFVIPNTLTEDEASLVITDPKAEMYAHTAEDLRQRGYRIQVLNLLDKVHSDRWNPLDYVGSVGDATDLATSIVANTTNPNRVKGDPFWDNAEQALLTALILYVKHHRPPVEQHLASVLELGTEPPPEVLDHIFRLLPRDSAARRFYRTFLRAEERVRAGILAGFGSRLQLWNDPEVVGLTANSDLRLEDLAAEKTAMYLIIPDSTATYAPLTALFYQQLFQTLYREADQNGGALPRRVRCRMDEVANCGFIPELDKRLSTMRSRLVSVEMILQSLGQLKNRYPQQWSELIGCCDTMLYLGGNDMETAQYVSGKLGNTTILVSSQGDSLGQTHRSHSENQSYQGRPLLYPDECMRLPADQSLVLLKGCDPARVTKLDFTELPQGKRLQIQDHHRYPAQAREPVVITDPDAVLQELRQRAAPAETTDPEPALIAGSVTDFVTSEEGGQA